MEQSWILSPVQEYSTGTLGILIITAAKELHNLPNLHLRKHQNHSNHQSYWKKNIHRKRNEDKKRTGARIHINTLILELSCKVQISTFSTYYFCVQALPNEIWDRRLFGSNLPSPCTTEPFCNWSTPVRFLRLWKYGLWEVTTGRIHHEEQRKVQGCVYWSVFQVNYLDYKYSFVTGSISIFLWILNSDWKKTQWDEPGCVSWPLCHRKMFQSEYTAKK